MADEQSYEWPKGRELSLGDIECAVRSAMDTLNKVDSEAIDTNQIYAAFAEQFDKLIGGGDIEWQFRPSKDLGRVTAGWLFDLIWYSVVRKEGLCLFRDVALIAEFELNFGLPLAQHDFLKILGFNSKVKVAIVNCEEADSYNLVSNAVRECRYITGGRYMIWRVNGNRIELFAEFDLCVENGLKRLNPIDGVLFKSKDMFGGW